MPIAVLVLPLNLHTLERFPSLEEDIEAVAIAGGLLSRREEILTLRDFPVYRVGMEMGAVR
jgi:hypothetical protein